MKTIEEVLQLNDKERITAVAGIIVSVEAPREPSQAQAAKGIHVQNFRIVSSKGTPLQCQFLSAAMHIDDSVRGQKIILKSADTERGPYGLQVNIYNGNLSLVVSKDASFTLKELKTNPAPPINPDEAQARMNQPVSRGPSIQANTLAYVSIYRTLKSELLKTEPTAPTFIESLPAIATIFIESARSGCLLQPEPIPAPLPMKKEAERDITPDPNQVLKHILTDAINGTLDARYVQADRAIALSETLTWDSVYDALVSYISVEHKIELSALLPIADSVFDTLRRNLGPKSASLDVSRAIAMDFPSFKEQVLKSLETGPTSTPEQTQTTNDPYEDIPL
jgi:hypothetical protein